MKVDLSLEVNKGRITLKGKTYNDLNTREKIIMNGLIKHYKLKNKTA